VGDCADGQNRCALLLTAHICPPTMPLKRSIRLPALTNVNTPATFASSASATVDARFQDRTLHPAARRISAGLLVRDTQKTTGR
jgi:hypothetical protein